MLVAHKCKRDSGQQKQIFDSLDVDHDGTLSIEELTDALMMIKSFRGNRGKA
jgi:Ca2+-binding EF-hand superfamily protein